MQSNEKTTYNSNYNSQQYLSSGPSHIPSPDRIISYKSEKVLNLVDFINQKHKCKIQNYFDQKASKKFLESKDIALKEIYLDDEIINTKTQSKISDEIKDKKKQKRTKTKKKYKSKKTFSCHKMIYIKEKKLKTVKTEKNLKVLSDINHISNGNKDRTKNLNNFDFSKICRKLMIKDDDIDVSSISNGEDK
jgi:hypothetical protein